MNRLLTCLCFVLLMTASCKDESEDNIESSFDSIDIPEDYVAIVLQNGSGSNSTRLFAIDDSKNITLVNINGGTSFYENNGFTNFIDLGNGFALVETSSIDGLSNERAYLIELESGKTRDLGDRTLPKSLLNFSVQIDDLGNVYLRDNDELYKITTGNFPDVNIEMISSPEMSVGSFAVDSKGNIVLYDRDAEDSKNEVVYIERSGAEHILKGTFYSYTYCWLGSDDELYLSASGVKKINKLTSELEVFSTDYLSSSCGWSHFLNITSSGHKIGIGNCNEDYVKVYPVHANLDIENLFGLEKITGAASSENYAYLCGQDRSGDYHVLRINPITDSFDDVNVGSVELHGIASSPNDIVTVVGIDLDDQQRFVANIDVLNSELEKLETFGNELKVFSSK